MKNKYVYHMFHVYIHNIHIRALASKEEEKKRGRETDTTILDRICYINRIIFYKRK